MKVPQMPRIWMCMSESVLERGEREALRGPERPAHGRALARPRAPCEAYQPGRREVRL